MTRRDDAFDDLKKGVLWPQLAKKYPKSTLYDAHTLYEPIAQKEYTDLQEKKETIQKEVHVHTTNLNELKTQEQNIGQKVKKVISDLKGLKQKKDQAQRQVEEQKKTSRDK
ncbi:hypothetical protein ACFL0D_08205 [Thermoproteota archaeon]